MNETSYIKSIHRRLSKDVYWWKINDRFTNGVPDAWYCGVAGGHLFVEYKFVALPVRDTTIVRVALSSPQIEWLDARSKQGIPVAVVVGSQDGGLWIDDLGAVRSGIGAAAFKNRMEDSAAIAAKIQKHVCQPGRNNAAVMSEMT